MRLMERNRELASTLIKLTDQIRLQQLNALNHSNLIDRLEKLKSDTEIGKRRWRVMKSLMAGTVVGSGINWATDNKLKTLVLDDEEDQSRHHRHIL